MKRNHLINKIVKVFAAMLLLSTTMLGLTGCGTGSQTNSKPESNQANEKDRLENDEMQYSLDTMKYIPAFECTDQNGNIIDNSIFAKADYSLIVLWGTWCSPCVGEIPILIEAEEELEKMGVQIIGVCEDGRDNTDSVNEILNKNNATYVNIMPSPEFYDDFVSLCFAFPTSMMVDSNGDVVKNAFSLEKESDALISQVKEILDELGETANKTVGDDNSTAEIIVDDSSDSLDVIYDAIKKDMVDAVGIDNPEVKNLEVAKEMHKKAYEYCTPSYYTESEVTRPDGPRTIKEYVDNGSYRSEEYVGNKLRWVTIYNDNDNTYYFYEVETKNLEKITKAREKGYNYDMYTLGCFEMLSNNALKGDFVEKEYNGKPALVSSYDHAESGFFNEVCFDKEKGIILYWLQVQGEKEYKTTYNVTPGEKLDPIIFTFDENKLTADEMLG